MKVLVLYQPKSDHARLIEEYIREYKSRSPSVQVQVLSLDSKEGDSMAKLYGIMQYPAILVLQNDGSMQHLWEGKDLPLIDEVVSYAAT
jgi:hypothetical protein